MNLLMILNVYSSYSFLFLLQKTAFFIGMKGTFFLFILLSMIGIGCGQEALQSNIGVTSNLALQDSVIQIKTDSTELQTEIHVPHDPFSHLTPEAVNSVYIKKMKKNFANIRKQEADMLQEQESAMKALFTS